MLEGVVAPTLLRAPIAWVAQARRGWGGLRWPEGPQGPSPGWNPGTRSHRALLGHPEGVPEGSPVALQAAGDRGVSRGPRVSPGAGLRRPFRPTQIVCHRVRNP